LAQRAKEIEMKFMLLQALRGRQGDVEPMSKWTPGEIEAHIAYQRDLNAALSERGELVDAQALTALEMAKFVVHDGAGAPSPSVPSRSPRSCLPATGSSTSSRPSGRSRSRPKARLRLARAAFRSSRRSRVRELMSAPGIKG
jgi:hypothetical protein